MEHEMILTWTQVLAIVEALIQNPALKPIEAAELAALRASLANNPFLLLVVNAVASAAGL